MLKVNIQSFTYPNAESETLSNIVFQLKKGEHLALLGESGCGKSTLLHLIFGLLNLDRGEIFYGKKQLFGPSHNLVPGHDFMKLVSQDLNLMPFTSVAENVGEHLARIDVLEDTHTIDEVLSVVGLLPYKNRKVNTLSGGQKQRVALAKALAKKPQVFLLDEPFSSIDTFRKNQLSREVFRYLKQQKIGCVFATHNADEALAFSDRILVLKKGRILQFGTPEKVYTSANSVYEKGFYGEISIIPAGVLSENQLIALPHELSISKEETALKIAVTRTYFKGSYYLIQGIFRGEKIYCNHPTSVTEVEVYIKRNPHGK